MDKIQDGGAEQIIVAEWHSYPCGVPIVAMHCAIKRAARFSTSTQEYHRPTTGMNPLQLPELIGEIAGHLTAGSDLVSLARSDRLAREMVTLLLFQDIQIPLASMAPLAAELRSNPTLAAACRSLTVCISLADKLAADSHADPPDDPVLDPSVYEPLYADLCTVLGVLEQHAHLTTFSVNSAARRYLQTWVEFPAKVWTAIAAVSVNLEVLEINVDCSEREHWVCPFSLCEFCLTPPLESPHACHDTELAGVRHEHKRPPTTCRASSTTTPHSRSSRSISRGAAAQRTSPCTRPSRG
jgi:hypothetical protein